MREQHLQKKKKKKTCKGFTNVLASVIYTVNVYTVNLYLMKEKTGDEIKKRPKQQNHEKSETTSKGLGSYPEDCELYCCCC